ncbi:hypothetical protein [Cryobacterium sp. PAMC25264]|uniref:hypothetical protein n=1 Tax=Cryobacterium sp. PAMC25264 TaxID=2861288 RepID=UPI001C6304E0|nr:hypothetical protein [Cryobacterium sp. PAMC25264]QYF73320.1 hypothetical protein KY500_16590 [Cryobacterium sp. PAMC25264]
MKDSELGDSNDEKSDKRILDWCMRDRCTRGGVLTAPAYGAEPRGSDIPDATSALDGTFQTQDGAAVEIVSDDLDQGERVVQGLTSNGVAVRFLVQSTSVSDADRDAIKQDLAGPTDPQTATDFGETTKGVETFNVTAEPLSPDLIWEPVSVIASTPSAASIAWTAGEFTAKVPEVGSEQSRGGEVILEELEPGSPYSAELESSETELVDEQLATRTRTVEFQTLPEQATRDDMSLFTYQNWTTAYIHKTFIPDATVDAIYCGQPSNTFGGDNRSYRTPSFDAPNEDPDYRTMMFGNVNWDNPAPYDFIWTRGIGASKIYNSGGGLVTTLYAGADDMVVKEISVGSSYAKAYFDHSSSNPHCSFFDVNYGGVIRYAEWVEFYRSGTVAVDGYRFKAPAHEMYARFNTASGSDVWRTISHRPNEGFQCLLGNGACGMDFYQASASY